MLNYKYTARMEKFGVEHHLRNLAKTIEVVRRVGEYEVERRGGFADVSQSIGT